jgi:hypothetical protein
MTARTKTTATTARATAKAKTRTTARITADPCASLRDDKQKNDNDEDFARKDLALPPIAMARWMGHPIFPAREVKAAARAVMRMQRALGRSSGG